MSLFGSDNRERARQIMREVEEIKKTADRRHDEAIISMIKDFLWLGNSKSGIMIKDMQKYNNVLGKLKKSQYATDKYYCDNDKKKLLLAAYGNCSMPMNSEKERLIDAYDIYFGKTGYVRLGFDLINAVTILRGSDELNAAIARKGEVRLYEQQVENICRNMQAVSERAQQLNNLLGDLSEKLTHCVRTVETIIDFWGTDISTYNDKDIRRINTAEEIAKTIKQLVDTPVVKVEDYSLTDESTEVMYYVKHKLKEWS